MIMMLLMMNASGLEEWATHRISQPHKKRALRAQPYPHKPIHRLSDRCVHTARCCSLFLRRLIIWFVARCLVDVSRVSCVRASYLHRHLLV